MSWESRDEEMEEMKELSQEEKQVTGEGVPRLSPGVGGGRVAGEQHGGASGGGVGGAMP